MTYPLPLQREGQDSEIDMNFQLNRRYKTNISKADMTRAIVSRMIDLSEIDAKLLSGEEPIMFRSLFDYSGPSSATLTIVATNDGFFAKIEGTYSFSGWKFDVIAIILLFSTIGFGLGLMGYRAWECFTDGKNIPAKLQYILDAVAVEIETLTEQSVTSADYAVANSPASLRNLEQLERLASLHDRGLLNAEEFACEKRRLLGA